MELGTRGSVDCCDSKVASNDMLSCPMTAGGCSELAAVESVIGCKRTLFLVV